MPLFALICMDKPGSLGVRMGARERHLAWAGSQPLVYGGPFLDENGDMKGSLMIIEAADLPAARAFNAADPYTEAGLWGSVDIHPYRVTIDKR